MICQFQLMAAQYLDQYLLFLFLKLYHQLIRGSPLERRMFRFPRICKRLLQRLLRPFHQVLLLLVLLFQCLFRMLLFLEILQPQSLCQFHLLLLLFLVFLPVRPEVCHKLLDQLFVLLEVQPTCLLNLSLLLR